MHSTQLGKALVSGNLPVCEHQEKTRVCPALCGSVGMRAFVEPVKAVSREVPSVKPCSAEQEWEQSGFTQNSPRDPIRKVGWGPSTGSSSWTIFGKEGDGWRLLQTEKHWKATKVQLEEEL